MSAVDDQWVQQMKGAMSKLESEQKQLKAEVTDQQLRLKNAETQAAALRDEARLAAKKRDEARHLVGCWQFYLHESTVVPPCLVGSL